MLQEARPGGYDPDDLVSDIRRALLRKEVAVRVAGRCGEDATKVARLGLLGIHLGTVPCK